MSDKTAMLDAMRHTTMPFVVICRLPDTPEPEVIINPVANMAAKMAYYDATYDNDLRHKFAPGVFIEGYEILSQKVLSVW